MDRVFFSRNTLTIPLLLIVLIISSCGGKNKDNDPVLTVTPTTLNFGTTSNSLPFTVNNTGGGTLNWSISSDQTWLSLTSSDVNQSTKTESDVVQIQVNRTGLSAGTHRAIITITSDAGDMTIPVSIVVSASNTGPGPNPNSSIPILTITSPAPNAIFAPNETIIFEGSGNDLEDGFLTNASLSWSSNISGPIGTGSQVITTSLPSGIHTITFAGTDSSGQIGTSVLTITVTGIVGTPTNTNPTITSASLTSAVVNTAYSYDVQANDIDGDSLSYALTVKPQTMTINATTGVINWLPVAVGTEKITVSVSDNKGGIATQSFVINIAATDTQAPNNTSGNAFINGGATATGSDRLILQLSALDNIGITGYFVADIDPIFNITPLTPLPNNPGWQTVPSSTVFNMSVPYTLSKTYPLNTTISVFVWFKDAAGKVSMTASSNILRSNLTKPTNATASEFIDNGALQTNLQSVTLNLAATDDLGVTGYYILDNSTGIAPIAPTATSAGWVNVTSALNYIQSVNYTFSTAYASNTRVHIYVWLKDADNQVSGLASDSILVIFSGQTPSTPGLGTIFEDDFEQGINAWSIENGVWDLISADADSSCFSGTKCIGTITHLTDVGHSHSLLSSSAIQLPALSADQEEKHKKEHDEENIDEIILSFWQIFDFDENAKGKVQISAELAPNVWSEWITLKDEEKKEDEDFSDSSSDNDWSKTSVMLDSYANTSIRIGLLFSQKTSDDEEKDDQSSDFSSFWAIDDINITINTKEKSSKEEK